MVNKEINKDNKMVQTKKQGCICCDCGKIYLQQDFKNPYSKAEKCCSGEYEFGYLQEDGKTFIS